MPGKYFFLIFFLLFSTARLKAEYKITERCTAAWEALLDLNTTTAKKIIDEEIKENPDNYYAYYLASTCEAFVLKINGSDAQYEQFISNFEERREFMDDKDTESPYYLYCESEMLLHMAIFNVLHGDKISGVRKGYQSYRRLYENIERFPDFKPNQKLDGFFNIALSNLPPFVKWMVSTFGIKGTSKEGFELMHDYFDDVKNTPGLNAEAALYILLSYKLNKDPKSAFAFISEQDSSITSKRLVKYFYANTAYRSGLNQVAFESMSKFNPDEMEMFFLPYDYMMGKIMLRKLDPQASYHLNRYLDLTEKQNYVKEITYKLALSYLVQGDIEKFKKYKKQARDEDEEITERDREAGYDCELDYTPDVTLTKCRLLLDGGYLERFDELFFAYAITPTSILPYQLEYELLKGRYEMETGENAVAVSTFKNLIKSGEDEDYYFASEAALRLGIHYREVNNYKEARKYFDLCLDLYDSDYYEYIEELAKKELIKMED